ncbi:MAG: HlyD family efflux transporter periplasmic adaptor subunit [Bacteroidales bacterium]|nr:HlyD family efflux transporter periplasmic adaptor subunit [Bacteroidales bacterium]
MKKIIIFLAAVVLFTACNNEKKYDAEGSFESDEVTVSAEANGKILSFNLREGDEIQAFQTVGNIDSVQIYLTKLQLEKNVKSVSSNSPDVSKQIAILEEQIRKVNVEHRRVENLLKDGAATQKQLDDLDSQLAVLQSQLEAQKSSLNNSVSSINAQSSSIEVQIDQVNDKLAKCVIVSPVSGTVLAKYAQAGEFTAIGKPLFKIADLQNVYLRAYLTSGQIARIKLGQQVKVFADFGGDNTHEYQGTIEWISSKSEFTPKNIQTDDERENLVYAVKVAVKNDGFIKLGMYGGIVIN